MVDLDPPPQFLPAHRARNQLWLDHLARCVADVCAPAIVCVLGFAIVAALVFT